MQSSKSSTQSSSSKSRKPSVRTRAAVGGIAVLSCAALAAGVASTSATAARASGGGHDVARLVPLNNSGALGRAIVNSSHGELDVSIDVTGLAPNLPHAQHIHFGADARQECPSVKDDANGDFRLTTSEGAPAYGPVRVSLTTKGDTSPDSVLAVDRFPTAPDGVEHYDRLVTTSKAVGRAIRRGEAVVVIHGVDYNNNGEYDFASAGASDLDPNLPAEATDPAICGVLR
jgi:hypothetical protein